MRRVRVVPLERAARRDRVEPHAHVVPPRVGQSHEPRARGHVKRAVRRAREPDAEDGERLRLRVLAPGLRVGGPGGDGPRPEVLRARRAGRPRADEQHVAGVRQRASHRRPGQAAAAQFRGHRRRTPGAAQTSARRKMLNAFDIIIE